MQILRAREVWQQEELAAVALETADLVTECWLLGSREGLLLKNGQTYPVNSTQGKLIGKAPPPKAPQTLQTTTPAWDWVFKLSYVYLSICLLCLNELHITHLNRYLSHICIYLHVYHLSIYPSIIYQCIYT